MGRHDGQRRTSTVHKAHVVLNAALSYAVKTGRLRVSPMAMLADEDRPKQRGADPR